MLRPPGPVRLDVDAVGMGGTAGRAETGKMPAASALWYDIDWRLLSSIVLLRLPDPDGL